MENLLANTAGAIVDIVALTLIAVFAIIGLKQGFAKTFVSTFGTFISLILAALLCSSAVNTFQNNFGLVESISNGLQGSMTGLFGDTIMNTTLRQATETNLAEAGVTSWIIKIVLSIQTSEIPMDVTLNQIICPVIAYYVVALISFVILFIIFKIMLFLLSRFVLKLYKIKIVKKTDKTLGVIFGLIRGILIIELAIWIISIIPLGFCHTLTIYIQNAPISNFLGNINLFSLIINSIANSGSLVNIILGII